MKKVCVVVTARPSYSRIRSAMKAMKEHIGIELHVVVAASALLEKYGNVAGEIEKDGYMISGRVFSLVEGETLLTSAKTTGLGIIELASVFNNIQPDAIVTIADRYETISTAIAASYMNIPLIHIQGGEVTGNIDEKVRHAITKLSDLHLVSTDKAKERVIKMGEDPKSVIVTGCPSIDIAKSVLEQNNQTGYEIIDKYKGVGKKLPNFNEYMVVIQHPVTTEINQSKQQVIDTMEAVRDAGIQTFWFWPNVDAGSDGTSKILRQYRERGDLDNVYFFKNMSPNDFLVLLRDSNFIIGNSSVAIRECSFMGIPAINIGNRQSGRERGLNVVDVGYNRADILNAIQNIRQSKNSVKDELYGNGDAGIRIAEAIYNTEISVNKKLYY